MRIVLALVAVVVFAVPSFAYVEAPMSLGALIAQSTNVCTMVVTKVDKQKNLIVYKKLLDVKGKHPQEEIKHNIGFGGLRPGEWQEIMNWAEVGKQAVFCHNGGASETYIGATWYQAYPGGEWWNMSHGEPFLLRSYSGKVEKFGGFVKELVDGREVIVPCLVDGDKEALHKKTAKVQRLRASLKIQDYNPKRDFTGWGGEDIRRLAGMPGFDRLAALGSIGADAQSISAVDFDADGKLDICLVGANRAMLLQNGGDAFSEVGLPGLVGGARSAVWADYDGDGLPDLLLATATGPKLYTNLGKGLFRDDSKRLPQEACYNLTAAAWIDADSDGHPDILLANGFHGLRLYRNARGNDTVAKVVPPKLGDWYAVGPFRQGDGKGNIAHAFAPEADAFDAAKKYKGKRDMECGWVKGNYPDGQVNSLAPFAGNCAIYLHRELDAAIAGDVPVSFGNRDAVTIWLNGEKIHADVAAHPVAPDQIALNLKLKAGKNRLLVKLCHAEGESGFYFKVGSAGSTTKPLFDDVSAAWGFGPDGSAGDVKGDTLTVADFTGDGKADFVYGAGTGLLFANTGNRFERKPDSGLQYATGKVGPVVEDFNGDGHLDLFVPQADGKCKLYRNDGTGKFTDVIAMVGDLSAPILGAVGAAWGDFDNDGFPDLIVTRLRGPNLYFKNNGNGTFANQTAEIGLNQKLFNTQAACLADINGDGRLDLLLANEGQDSAILFGATTTLAKKTPVTIDLAGTSLPVGGIVTVKAADGSRVAASTMTGGDARGGQSGLAPRFALLPGNYKVEIRKAGGSAVVKDIVVAASPMNIKW